MRITLIQLNHFRLNWKRFGLGDRDLQVLERAIMENPAGAPVMSGAGGLRKIRFARAAASGGKSGGMRVCYAYFREYDIVYLCAVYPKSEKANLSRAERNAYRTVLTDFQKYLGDHFAKGWTP